MRKKIFKRVLAIVLAIIIPFSINGTVYAVNYTFSANEITNVEDILTDYHSQLIALEEDNTKRSASALAQEKKQIKARTIERLTKAGYEAYDINETTYAETETALNIDFSVMGLLPTGSYIMVLHGEELGLGKSGENARDGSETEPVSYTASDGVTYLIKFATVTGDENPLFLKSGEVDLLASSNEEAIYACLDGLIGAVISGLYPVIGTVLSLTTLSIEDFMPGKRAELELHCLTAWTRVYTLVWNEYLNGWSMGSCVEYATATSYVTGHYYDTELNAFIPIPYNNKYVREYSEKCFNFNWRKEQGVKGMKHNQIYYDGIGDVGYTYNGEVVLTHRENF